MPARIHKAQLHFQKLSNNQELIHNAVENLKYWLFHPNFENYQPQIDYLIESKNFEELFDCFCQVIPFGTGGRRGKVGMGPNRINPWTIAASAQGHSQYLIKKHRDEAKEKGIVIAYDVRQFTDLHVDDHKKTYNKNLPNPIWGITSRDLAEIAATVYVKNGIRVHFFERIAPTPQLSFTIRYLNAIAGINISASHNPPDYNGKKVYDHTGGQLLPPFDQELVDEINKNVKIHKVSWGNFYDNVNSGMIKIIEKEVEDSYINATLNISKLNEIDGENEFDNRKARIIFSPLHGTGKESIYKSMKRLGFNIHLDPESSIPSGEFESIPDHIPNPERKIVFEKLEKYADEIDADLIIASDPDADRIGISAKIKEEQWQALNGNEIITLLSEYLLRKNHELGPNNNRRIENPILMTSIPCTRIIEKISKKYRAELRNYFPPGFKYFANEMNQLEKSGKINRFLIAMEDSFGHLCCNYARDKDGCTASILLSEYACELKSKDKTLLDALNEIYKEYGYHLNIIDSIKFKHTYEKEKIEKIMNRIRKKQDQNFPELKIIKYKDHLKNQKIVSETDRSSRNLIEFEIEPKIGFDATRILVRPSGTEPKLKIYIEISLPPNRVYGKELAKNENLIENMADKKLEAEKEINKILNIVHKNINF